MRAILCLLILALAGCSGGPSDSAGADSGGESSGTSSQQSQEAQQAPEEERRSESDATDELIALAVVDCPLTDIEVYLGGAGARDITSTRCLFENLDVPEGAVAFDALFTWDATFAEGDMGIRVSDQTRCSVDGGDGCNLGDTTGASPVLLEMAPADLGNHELADLDIYPIGWAVQPDWSLQITFYG